MGPHKDREKLWPGWELNHDLRGRSPLLYQLSYKVRRDQAVGTDDEVTAMNMLQVQRRITFFANVGSVALIFEQT